MNVYEELLKYCQEPLIQRNKRVINALSQGPIGRPDSQLLLGEEGEKAWHVTTTLKGPREKLVLFCDPFFEHRRPSTYEPELWEELLAHHGVYRWEGSHVPLEELDPHNNVEAFWNDPSKMPYETKEQIIESLRQQGLNPDHFIVLDAQDYYDFLGDFTLRMTERRGYSKDEHFAVPPEDAVVLYIKKNLILGDFLKTRPGIYSHMRDFVPDQILEILVNIRPVEKIEMRVNGELGSADELEKIFSKYYNTELQFMYLATKDGSENYYLPRLFIKNLEVNIGCHSWDLSAIEGCENLTINYDGGERSKKPLIFPPHLTKLTLKNLVITPELRLAMPDSIEELEIKAEKHQDLEEIISIIKTLPNLKSLSLDFDDSFSDDFIGLKELQLKKLRVKSTTKVYLREIPPQLETLICDCKSIEFSDLKEHHALKTVYLKGEVRYIDYLPSSVEFLEIRNHKSAFTGEEYLLKRLCNIKWLALIDCRTIEGLEDLSPTLEGLCLVKCNSMKKLNVTGLRNLKVLDLAPLNPGLKIKSDEPLTSVRYISAARCQIDQLRAPNYKQLHNTVSFRQVGARELLIDRGVHPNLSSLDYERVIIEKSILMDESYYPRNVKSILVYESVAWKFDLDCKRFYQLEELELSNVRDLVVIKNLPSTLKRIKISGCENFRGIDFAGIEKLESLTLRDLNPEFLLMNSDKIRYIDNIEVDNASDYQFDIFNLIARLKSCSSLIIRNDSRIGMLTFPKSCASITIQECPKIMSLDFSKVQFLKSVTLEWCYELALIRSFPPSLENLCVRYNYSLDVDAAVDLSNLPNLRAACLFLNGPEIRPENHRERVLKEGKEPSSAEIKAYVQQSQAQIELNARSRGLSFTDQGLYYNGVVGDCLQFDRMFLYGNVIFSGFSKTSQTPRDLVFSGLYLARENNLPKYLNALKLERCFFTTAGIDLSGFKNLKNIEIDNNLSDVVLSALPPGIMEIALSNTSGIIQFTVPASQELKIVLNGHVRIELPSSEKEYKISLESKDNNVRILGLPKVVKSLSVIGVKSNITVAIKQVYTFDLTNIEDVEQLYIASEFIKSVGFVGISQNLIIRRLVINNRDVRSPLSDEMKRFIQSARILDITLGKLSYVSGLKFNSSVRKIELQDCGDMEDIEFGECANLRYLKIVATDVQKIQSLPPLLETLILEENHSLAQPSLSGLRQLKTIQMIGNKDRDIQATRRPINETLRDLYPKTTRKIVIDSLHHEGKWDMPDLVEYTQLEKLTLRRMKVFETVKIPKKIKELEVQNCYSVGRVVDFKDFHDLNDIALRECANLEVVENLPAQLTRFAIINCAELCSFNLNSISRLYALCLYYEVGQKTQLSWGRNLSIGIIYLNSIAYAEEGIVQFIRSLKGGNIEVIVESGDKFVATGNESRVTGLRIQDNNTISGELSLRQFTQLRRLDVSGCNNITAITDFPKSIKEIILHRNSSLKMPDLDGFLDTLEKLQIGDCKLINPAPALEINTIARPGPVRVVQISARKENDIDLDTLRSERLKKQNREIAEKRYNTFQAYVDKMLQDNVGYEEASSFGSTTADGIGITNRHKYNTMKISGSTVYAPDSKTGFVTRFHDSNNKAAGDEQNNFLMVYDKRNLLVNNYFRFSVYNAIECDVRRRSLLFCYRPKEVRRTSLVRYQNCDRLGDDTLHDLKHYVSLDQNWAMAYAEFDIKPGQEITLVTTPVLYPPDELFIYCNDAKDLDLILDVTERKVSVALKAGVESKCVKLAYRFRMQDCYLLENFGDDLKLCLSPKPLLKADFIAELEKVISAVAELKPLTRSDISLREKLACLFEFCRNFNQEDTTDENSSDTLDIILSQIKSSKGVCRHRSQVFMVLAHYLNIPVSLFSNGKHMFGELPFYSRFGFVRHGVCLGGGDVLDLVKKSSNPQPEPVNPFIKVITEPEPTKSVAVAEPKPSIEAEAKAKAKAREEAERKAREEAEAKTRAEAERKAKEDVVAKAREEAERKAREEAEAKAREEAERKAREEAEVKAREEAERKAREEAEVKAREEAERKAREEAEAKAREEAERKAREEAEVKAREEAERKAREEAEAKARDEAQRKAKEAEARRIAEEKALEAREPFPAVKIITSILPLLSKEAAHAPLLRLPNNLEPLKVFARIREELSGVVNSPRAKNVIYIHNPTDLRRYMKSVKIADGERKLVAGPLRQLLEEGGIIVINWTEFSKQQKASYMSMLEQPSGTLMGVPVTASVKIISLIQDKFRTGPRAFFSRTTAFLLSQSYSSSVSSIERSAISDEFIEVDLYGMPNWRERLFGEILVDELGYHIRENGALIRALTEKKNLRLVNCPDSENFNLFLQRLRVERRWYVNSQFIEIPASFVIQTDNKEHAIRNRNITIKNKPDEDSALGVFCNANNLYECFRREIVNPNTRMRTETLPWFATEESQFYITEVITREEWQELLDRFGDFTPRPITFTLLPGGAIQGVAEYAGEQSAEIETSLLTFSNDPDFYVNELKRHLLPDAIIVDVHSHMTYQELIAQLADRRDDSGKIEFEYSSCVVMDDLIKGRSIILNGAMSLLLYQQLLPYLYPNLARFDQNGKEVKLKGQLICVMPLECRDDYPYQYIQIEQITVDRYLELLPEADIEFAHKIMYLFKLAAGLNHRGIGQPPVPVLTYRRLTAMIARMKDESLQSVHLENPIKGLFHYDYPKNSDNYAFLAVVSKYCFAPESGDKSIHVQKWSRLRKARGIHTLADLEKHVWKALNCCYGKTLRALVGNSLDTVIQIEKGRPKLIDAHLAKKLFGILCSEEAKEKIEVMPSHHKQTQQLQTLFYHQATRAIFLKSKPGTGKSHQTRELRSQLPDGHYFKGIMQLDECLSADPQNDRPIVNAPDEVNMELPGTLDVFKGFFRNGPMHYRGQYYRAKSQLKFVGSGNPESYPNRFFHLFLQEYAETVLFELPRTEWLRENIVEVELQASEFSTEEKNQISEKLLWAFFNIKEYEPHCEISLRDLRSLVQRFLVVYQLTHNIEESVRKSQWHEFGFLIRDVKKRQQYKEVINLGYEADVLSIEKVGNLYIPSTKYSLVEIIREDLAMCDDAAVRDFAYRRGLLLEGPSGIGKSSLYKAILEEQGYRKGSADPAKRYYEISLDEGEEAARLVIKAFCEGSKIILDEIDTRIEKLLIALMEGELPEDPDLVRLIHEVVGNELEIKAGGFVMASQNPGEVMSLALLNRFHYVQASDYTNEELKAVLIEAHIENPDHILNKFNEARSRDPVNYNPRKLFEWMRKQIEERHEENIVIQMV